jgi:hypothetical protein
MTLVNASDIWLFVSSSGGVTAGRTDAEHALFPYETADRLHETPEWSGPITQLWVHGRDGGTLWRPFDLDASHFAGAPTVRRRLSKDRLGTCIRFEEDHLPSGLRIRASWQASERYGIVRTVKLTNTSSSTVSTTVLDGFRNVLPTGIPRFLQREFSCLTDAYKTSDYDTRCRLAIYSLTEAISDRAEPQESLRAAVVWARGLEGATVSLHPRCVASFQAEGQIRPEHDVRGKKGAFFQCQELQLSPGEEVSWQLVADVNHDHRSIQALRQELSQSSDISGSVVLDIHRGEQELVRLLAAADALQDTGTEAAVAHHAVNVAFNCMRGGLFPEGYRVGLPDFWKFVEERNWRCAAACSQLSLEMPSSMHVLDLLQAVDAHGDENLRRLAREYLPLSFGRRHGDPSRPWNRFSIPAKRDGQRQLAYEGNWRDVFQNWEALCFSYPCYLPSVCAKFLNAMTRDGYNPYRLGRSGIDWEVPQPDNPFSHIGYWGDHQVVYLCRLLEHHAHFFPGQLGRELEERIYSFADVPYHMRPYADRFAAPRHTLDFDGERHRMLEARARELGADGKLLHDAAGDVLHASLAEKLLVICLSKCSNYIPGAGIWLNTQRPEWNDANNALVGHAASLVTLFQLYRFQEFLLGVFRHAPHAALQVDTALMQWLDRLRQALWSEPSFLEPNQAADGVIDRDEGRARKRLMKALGVAFDAYRKAPLGTARQAVNVSELCKFLELVQSHYGATLKGAREPHGCFAAYRLLELSEGHVSVQPLFDMLEGQVAAVASGRLTPTDSADLVDRLVVSDMYRADQKSLLLYPKKLRPQYLERNRAPESILDRSLLVQRLVSAGDTSLAARDAFGTYRFHPDLTNARELSAQLERLATEPGLSDLVEHEKATLHRAYEQTFQHRRYTGRSGTMYGYEGIGCIYWHMVSKLLLAMQDCALDALDAWPEALDQHPEQAGLLRLAYLYFKLRSGLCFNKTAQEYGAFPTDPYSHTPFQGGAQQPGLTGQVKEGVLLRFGELGVRIRKGRILFHPRLLARTEFRERPSVLRYVDTSGAWREVPLEPGSLGFTYCQVPVVYRWGDTPSLRFWTRSGTVEECPSLALPPAASRQVFERRGEVDRVLRTVSLEELLDFSAASDKQPASRARITNAGGVLRT